MKKDNNRDLILVLIASIETILIAALGTSIIAAIGQGTSSFTGTTQWAIYSYAGILGITIVAQCLFISTSRGNEQKMRVYLAALADAQCVATFQVFVYYTTFILKSLPLGFTTPAVDRIINSSSSNNSSSVQYYVVNDRLNWVIAAIGDSSWEQRSELMNSTTTLSTTTMTVLVSTLSDNASATVGGIVGQIFVGFTLAYLLVMLLGSVYICHTSAGMGVVPRLFTDSASLTIANGLVVIGMEEAIEIGFMGCTYAGLTANSVGLILLSTFLIFDWLILKTGVYILGYCFGEKRVSEWTTYRLTKSGGRFEPDVSKSATLHEASERLYEQWVIKPIFRTSMAIIPTLVCLSRRAWETGHGITLAASFILAFFSILSTWMSWTQATTTISNDEEEESTTTKKKNDSDDNIKQLSIMKLDVGGDHIFQKQQNQQRSVELSTPIPMTTKHPSGGGLAASIFSLYTSSSQQSQQKSGRYSA